MRVKESDKTPRSQLPYCAHFHHAESRFFFARKARKFKISIKRANLHPTFISLCKIRLFNIFFLGKKNGIRDSNEKNCVKWDSREKRAGMLDQAVKTPSSRTSRPSRNNSLYAFINSVRQVACVLQYGLQLVLTGAYISGSFNRGSLLVST